MHHMQPPPFLQPHFQTCCCPSPVDSIAPSPLLARGPGVDSPVHGCGRSIAHRQRAWQRPAAAGYLDGAVRERAIGPHAQGSRAGLSGGGCTAGLRAVHAGRYGGRGSGRGGRYQGAPPLQTSRPCAVSAAMRSTTSGMPAHSGVARRPAPPADALPAQWQ